MSETEQTQNIEITKPKRVYRKKTKEVVSSEDSTPMRKQELVGRMSATSLEAQEPEHIAQIEKPKRVYKKRIPTGLECSRLTKQEECVTNSDRPHERDLLGITDNVVIKKEEVMLKRVKHGDGYYLIPVGEEPMGQKKERTPKQMEAFLKMQEARLTKQQEVKMLKKIEKEKARLEEEEYKVDELLAKRVAHAPVGTSQMGQQYAPHAPVGTSQMGQPIPRQVSNQPKYLFL
jgi:hypothetical protein